MIGALWVLPASAGATTQVSYDQNAGLQIVSQDDVRDSFLQVSFESLSNGSTLAKVSTFQTDSGAAFDATTAGTGCTKPSNVQLVHCLVTGVAVVSASLRGGNDEFDCALRDCFVTGGAGADEIRGRVGFDSLDGGDGNDLLSGGMGNDLLKGGNGNDTFSSNATNQSGGADTLLGGAGNDLFKSDDIVSPDHFVGGKGGTDTADYSVRTTRVLLSTTGEAGREALVSNDGASGELDDLDEVERLIGGQGGDSLRVDDTPGILIGGPGADTLQGGSQDDTILARDGVEDDVSCGGGSDVGEVDLRDVGFAATCESGGEQDRREGAHVRIGTRSARASRDGSLLVRLACPRAARRTCAGTLRARGKASGVRSRYRIRRGREGRVRVRLSVSDGRRLVKRARRIRLISVERGRHGPRTTWRTIPVRR